MPSLRREKKTGKWGIRYSYVLPNGKRGRAHIVPNWPTILSEEEARSKMAFVIQEDKALRIRFQSQSEDTLSNLKSRYLEDLALDRRSRTIRQADYDLSKHVIPALGGEKEPIVTAFSQSSGHRLASQIKDSGLWPTSQKEMLIRAKAFAKWAYEQGVLSAETLMAFKHSLRLPKDLPSKRPARDNFWSYEEWQSFEFTFDSLDPWLLLFRTEFWGALRIGELLGLQCGDLDKELPKLTIQRQRSGIQTQLPPKTLRSRGTIALPHWLWKDLLAASDGESKDSPLFFPHKPASEKTLRRLLQSHAKIAGIRRITPHGLRHSMATLMLHKGATIAEVANHLRDSNGMVLKTYVHAIPDTGFLNRISPDPNQGKD